MSNYTHRPTEMFCTEVNQETFDLIKAWAEKSGIEWNYLSMKYVDRDPMVTWVRGKIVTGNNPNRYPVLPLSDFIAKFKTPTETDEQKQERLIEELLTTIKNDICQDMDIYKSKVYEIQSIKPKS